MSCFREAQDGVKFPSDSVQTLRRYFNIQTGRKVCTEYLNLGNPSDLMT